VKGDEFYYLPQRIQESAWNLEIQGAGQSNIGPNQNYPSHKHPAEYQLDWNKGRILPGFQVLYITRGTGLLETQKTPPIILEAPVLFLLFPNIWHRYRPNAEIGWHEHWIGFDGPIPRQMIATGAINSGQPLFQVGHHDKLLAQFQLALDEVKNEALGFRRIAAASVLQILALATSLPLRTEEENQPMRATVRQACFLFRERTDNVVSIESIAEELNVGYTYFRRMFKLYTGFSPKQYHTQLRFERVKRLLNESDLSIGEIAALLNFDSTFHLSQWFKKLAHSSPKMWRKQKLEISKL
jgi:AraC-like DNA-binding protein